jgi:hypothetical protein
VAAIDDLFSTRCCLTRPTALRATDLHIQVIRTRLSSTWKLSLRKQGQHASFQFRARKARGSFRKRDQNGLFHRLALDCINANRGLGF